MTLPFSAAVSTLRSSNQPRYQFFASRVDTGGERRTASLRSTAALAHISDDGSSSLLPSSDGRHNGGGAKFVDPRTLEGCGARELGEWQRSGAKRLQPRDKAYIRYLHAQGVAEQDIAEESSWSLKTVRKAIKNDYGHAGLKVSEEEAARHVCPEFQDRLRAIQTRIKSKERALPEALDSEQGPRQGQYYRSPLPPSDRDNSSSHRSSTSATARRTSSGPARDTDDVFVHAFLAGTSLDEEWFTHFRESGMTKRTLRHVAQMPHQRADAYFARLAPGMTFADRLILIDALLDLDK
ncbi:hypothetical protein B0H15DRAFT_858843 [Mycena belliarum]|uniref:Uncharacterized protein n=1 Tax=Mycena belliarum TaxID=1033014 RepID=A0AAD6TTR5_9AGAR|nr:hypothetical protein B0H15DRAFT_858843 [Mycena belliae]